MGVLSVLPRSPNMQILYECVPESRQHSSPEYANHLGPKSEQRLFDSADFWGVFNS